MNKIIYQGTSFNKLAADATRGSLKIQGDPLMPIHRSTDSPSEPKIATRDTRVEEVVAAGRQTDHQNP